MQTTIATPVVKTTARRTNILMRALKAYTRLFNLITSDSPHSSCWHSSHILHERNAHNHIIPVNRLAYLCRYPCKERGCAMTTDQHVLDKLAELNAFGNERLQMHYETILKVNSIVLNYDDDSLPKDEQVELLRDIDMLRKDLLGLMDLSVSDDVEGDDGDE